MPKANSLINPFDHISLSTPQKVKISVLLLANDKMGNFVLCIYLHLTFWRVNFYKLVQKNINLF